MTGSHVPPGYQPVSPYLTVEGAADLIAFLLEVFEAREVHRTCTPDGLIANALLELEGGTVEINDVRPDRPPKLGAVHVFVPDVDQTHRRALQAGARSVFEPEDAPFGQRIAAVDHPSGTSWYLSTAIDTDS